MILSDDDEETSLRNVINGSCDLLSNRQMRGIQSNQGESINDTQISFLTRDGKQSEAKNPSQFYRH